MTKRLNFDNEVLTNLRSMEWRNDGKLGVITGGQLERGLYMRINKDLKRWAENGTGKQADMCFSLTRAIKLKAYWKKEA